MDIWKHEEHNKTHNFLDIIDENNLIPLITKPTRLTCYSKTIIDILTNTFKEYLTHESGIIFATISDHFPVYHICRNIKVTSTEDCFIWKRRKTTFL